MWGQQLLLDVRGGRLDAVRSGAAILAWCADLLARIDMRAYGDPLLAHFAEHDPQAAGFSLVQLIETSAVVGHFVDATGDIYLDIFSCKPFDPQAAIDCVVEHFQPQRIRSQQIERQA